MLPTITSVSSRRPRKVFWLSFLFIYFGEHISGQFNSSVSQGLTPWCSASWIFGWNMDSRGLCDLGWLPESSPSSRDSHRKTGKEMRTHAQSWEHSLSPTPHGNTTGGFSHTTHEHPPRPLQQVSAAHTSLPIWFQEMKIHRKTIEGQEASKFKYQSQVTCLLMAPPASAGNIAVSKASEKAQYDYVHL